MDPIRNTGTARPRPIGLEQHNPNPDGPEPSGVSPRSAGMSQATLALSPRRTMSGNLEVGPSSLPPRGARPAPRMLPHLNAAVPDSPQSETQRLPANMPGSARALPGLNASPSPSPRAELEGSLASNRDDAQWPDLSGLLELIAQLPEMESEVPAGLSEAIMQEQRRQLEQLLGADFLTDVEMETSLGTQLGSINGLASDLNRQQDPLGSEIHAWVHLTGEPIESAHAFDDEDDAASFARLLARLRGPASEGTSAAPEQTAAQVSSVIHAIANDAVLRAQVFSLAEDALGSCGDNLAEGFSNIRLAVDNHRMARAVEAGEVNAKQLNEWAGSLFRLSLLEGAVHRFISTQLQRSDLPQPERGALTNEPLETMVHAKVELRQLLELPKSTASEMKYSGCSVLGQSELSMLEREVKAQAEDGEVHGKFLLGHPTWRAGMRMLHAQDFKDLKTKQDDDPFFDLDVPADLEGQVEYAAKARRVEAKHAREENAMLLRLAAGG